MRIMCVGDIHLKVKNAHLVTEALRRIRQKADELKPDLVVFLGDIFDGHESVHIHSLSVAAHQFSEFSVPVWMVPGNHDMHGPLSFLPEDHALALFRGWANVNVVEKPMVFMEAEGIRFVLCPYVPPGRFAEALSGIDMTPETVIFAHQEFRGAQFGSRESSVGDDWPASSPPVFSGHIHGRQQLHPNVLYVGTPYQVDFGDMGDKTISLFEFHNTFGIIWTEDRFDLGLPKKTTIDLTVEEAREFSVPEGATLRINLIGTTEDIMAFKKSKQYQSLESSAKVIPSFIETAAARRNIERKSYLDLLREKCKDESELVRAALDEVTQNVD